MLPCFSGVLLFMILLKTISKWIDAAFIMSALTSSDAPASTTERWPNGLSTRAIQPICSAVFAVESTRSREGMLAEASCSAMSPL